MLLLSLLLRSQVAAGCPWLRTAANQMLLREPSDKDVIHAETHCDVLCMVYRSGDQDALQKILRFLEQHNNIPVVLVQAPAHHTTTKVCHTKEKQRVCDVTVTLCVGVRVWRLCRPSKQVSKPWRRRPSATSTCPSSLFYTRSILSKPMWPHSRQRF